jgi:hypothetical protein
MPGSKVVFTVMFEGVEKNWRVDCWGLEKGEVERGVRLGGQGAKEKEEDASIVIGGSMDG